MSTGWQQEEAEDGEGDHGDNDGLHGLPN